MDRRTFLATSAAGLAVASAGCSGLLGSHVDLADPETGTQDGGRERYLTYRHDGERVVTLGFDQQTVPASPTDQFEFRITVPHSDDTEIESFRFDLRAPRHSIDPPADVYLSAPAGGLWPDLTYEVVENQWTRIALEDTGDLGSGTVTVETIVRPHSVPVTEVGIRAEIGLSASGAPPGRTYRVETNETFEPVRE